MVPRISPSGRDKAAQLRDWAAFRVLGPEHDRLYALPGRAFELRRTGSVHELLRDFAMSAESGQPLRRGQDFWVGGRVIS